MNHLVRPYPLLVLAAFVVSCSAGIETKEQVKLADQPFETSIKAKDEWKLTVPPDEADINKDWVFDKVSGSALQFKNGKGINTKLNDLKYIGQVSNGTEVPFFIYIGRNCDNCGPEQNRIYVYSPSDTSRTEKGAGRYQLPKTRRYSNGQTYYKSRVFYGQVLKETKGLLIYQEHSTYETEPEVNKSIFLVKLNDGVKKHLMISRERGEFQETLQLLNEGRCREISE